MNPPSHRSWYVLRVLPQHLRLVGPIDFETLKSQLADGKIAFTDFIYEWDDEKTWVRILEVPELHTALPPAPVDQEFAEFEKQISNNPSEPTVRISRPTAVQPPPFSLPSQSPGQVPPVDLAKIEIKFKNDWYIQFQGKEYGAYSFTEIRKIFESGKLASGALLWQKRLRTWIKTSSFQNLIESLPVDTDESVEDLVDYGSNRRAFSRKIIVASASVKVGNLLHTGICADISEGGIQVLRMDADLQLRAPYQLTIRPLELTGVPSFTIRAQLMWKNAEKKRMGFQFLDKMETATLAIYLGRATKSFNRPPK